MKQDYYKYFKAILPELESGAVIVADNVIHLARAMEYFLEAMGNDPIYDMRIIRALTEKRDGIAVIYKKQ